RIDRISPVGDQTAGLDKEAIKVDRRHHLVRTRARELRRVHWGKEASGLGLAFPYWIAIKLICYRIIDTLVEATIRRWCCHLRGNSFTGRWQIVIAIRQHSSFHRPTILSPTA